MSPASSPKRIGLLAFDDVAALDLSVVLEAFSIADGAERGRPRTRYETVVIGLAPGPVTAESGLRLLPDATLADAPELDTLIVPGGCGLRRPEINAAVAAWLRARAGRTRRLVSVCTGLYGLAASGLLDGRRATTHWGFTADVAARFPKVRLEPNAIFVKDGPFYSSAGMTAGIDLALALIEEDHGPALAMTVARYMVVYMKRSGGQLQYSEPLRFQTRAGDPFADLAALMVGDLSADWSVEAMAGRARLSTRQFTRRFKAAFGVTPAVHLETLRLDEARLRLASGHDGLARIAHAVGFQSDDVFRRAFERRFGVTPGAYRGRFAPSSPSVRSPDDDAAVQS